MSNEIVVNIENLSLSFGGIRALNGVSTRLLKGEILAIIGPMVPEKPAF